MAEKIKKHKSIIFIIGVGLLFAIAGLIISGMSGMVGFPNFAQAATTTQTVTVTATVNPWLYFSVTPTSLTLSPDLVDITGNVNIGSSTANVTMTVGTNSSGGWNIGIRGLYGGLGTTTANLIPSVPVSATTTISAGVDGYGANATGSIANVVVAAGYGGWGTAAVGAIASSTSQVMLSKTTSNASSTVGLMKVYAACDSTQPVGSYTDTITLTLTGQ
ncbi:MAG: hypothetical protein NTV01_08410 [Bacteroidia bacterium]|nr:hypothetical protein [Bacteroidia bacterium]